MNKRQFIRAVANDSNFTMKDVTIILHSMIKILEQVLESKVPFKVRGFGQIIYSKLPERNVSKKISPRGKRFPEATRITFRLAQNLKEKVR